MRDAIARALTWVLTTFLTPHRPGRHTADFLTAQPQPLPPAPVSPWSRPWTSPSKEEAAAFFRQQDAADQERRVKRERRRAAALAARGIDYPYTYDGAPFGPDAFAVTEASA
ncbi:hypothetical protein IAG44_19560 [Streptomyces roseirectus]|uniref:Uncharacterized protein n=1 Tax=Streptomyces roseirectus TaxID=2768066 RepID=A0A7H0IF47_9ACTN|nr:hypothetical protein [Streptomyces roseirectus]QNP71413.1 hypothetical protein IAG44_19560 [Streptomyces roseirectus]